MTSQKTKLLTPLLLLFMLAMILANMGGNMYGPLEALYLKELGAGIGQIGLFYTISQIVPLLLQILGGWVSDSLGTPARHRHWQRGGHLCVCPAAPGYPLGMGAARLRAERDDALADRSQL